MPMEMLRIRPRALSCISVYQGRVRPDLRRTPCAMNFRKQYRRLLNMHARVITGLAREGTVTLPVANPASVLIG